MKLSQQLQGRRATRTQRKLADIRERERQAITQEQTISPEQQRAEERARLEYLIEKRKQKIERERAKENPNERKLDRLEAELDRLERGREDLARGASLGSVFRVARAKGEQATQEKTIIKTAEQRITLGGAEGRYDFIDKKTGAIVSFKKKDAISILNETDSPYTFVGTTSPVGQPLREVTTSTAVRPSPKVEKISGVRIIREQGQQQREYMQRKFGKDDYSILGEGGELAKGGLLAIKEGVGEAYTFLIKDPTKKFIDTKDTYIEFTKPIDLPIVGETIFPKDLIIVPEGESPIPGKFRSGEFAPQREGDLPIRTTHKETVLKPGVPLTKDLYPERKSRNFLNVEQGATYTFSDLPKFQAEYLSQEAKLGLADITERQLKEGGYLDLTEFEKREQKRYDLLVGSKIESGELESQEDIDKFTEKFNKEYQERHRKQYTQSWETGVKEIGPENIQADYWRKLQEEGTPVFPKFFDWLEGKAEESDRKADVRTIQTIRRKLPTQERIAYDPLTISYLKSFPKDTYEVASWVPTATVLTYTGIKSAPYVKGGVELISTEVLGATGKVLPSVPLQSSIKIATTGYGAYLGRYILPEKIVTRYGTIKAPKWTRENLDIGGAYDVDQPFISGQALKFSLGTLGAYTAGVYTTRAIGTAKSRILGDVRETVVPTPIYDKKTGEIIGYERGKYTAFRLTGGSIPDEMIAREGKFVYLKKRVPKFDWRDPKTWGWKIAGKKAGTFYAWQKPTQTAQVQLVGEGFGGIGSTALTKGGTSQAVQKKYINTLQQQTHASRTGIKFKSVKTPYGTFKYAKIEKAPVDIARGKTAELRGIYRLPESSYQFPKVVQGVNIYKTGEMPQYQVGLVGGGKKDVLRFASGRVKSETLTPTSELETFTIGDYIVIPPGGTQSSLYFAGQPVRTFTGARIISEDEYLGLIGEAGGIEIGGTTSTNVDIILNELRKGKGYLPSSSTQITQTLNVLPLITSYLKRLPKSYTPSSIRGYSYSGVTGRTAPTTSVSKASSGISGISGSGVSLPSVTSAPSTPSVPSSPSVPTTPTIPYTPTPVGFGLFLPGTKRKKKRKKDKKVGIRAYLPDFTTKALGLDAVTVNKKNADRLTKQIQTGFEVRRGVKLK